MIEVVDLNKNKVKQFIKYDKLEGVHSLIQLRDQNIYCGCKEKILKYDIENNTLSVIVKKAHTSTISAMLKINEHMFISSSSDKTIKLWNY